MPTCEHCQSKNSLDSHYCKSCGREVPEAARNAEREENAKLIAEGYSLMGQGRTDEAELLAQTVLEIDPNSPGALSLVGMVRERQGDRIGALEAYEKVLKLSPDSPLDKVKAGQLKQTLSKPVAEPKPNRKLAFLGAAAAVLLTGATGVVVATLNGRPAQANSVALTSPVAVVTQQSFPNSPVVPTTAAANSETPEVDPPTSATVAETRIPTADNVSSGVRRSIPSPRANATAAPNPAPGRYVDTLPDPNAVGSSTVASEEEVRPFSPPVPTGASVQLVPTPPSTSRDPNDPGAEGRGGSATSSAPAETPAERRSPAIIEIRTHKGASAGGGQRTSADGSENGAEAAVRAAQAQQQVGNHDGAARALERARQMGKDDGVTNQRLGSSYERLGRKSEAITAYERAIRSLEAEARKGDPKAKARLESTKQALRNLRGN